MLLKVSIFNFSKVLDVTNLFTLLVDLIEAKIGPSGLLGVASQSIQLAPMDPHYAWINTTPEVTFYNNISTTYQK